MLVFLRIRKKSCFWRSDKVLTTEEMTDIEGKIEKYEYINIILKK